MKLLSIFTMAVILDSDNFLQSLTPIVFDILYCLCLQRFKCPTHKTVLVGTVCWNCLAHCCDHSTVIAYSHFRSLLEMLSEKSPVPRRSASCLFQAGSYYIVHLGLELQSSWISLLNAGVTYRHVPPLTTSFPLRCASIIVLYMTPLVFKGCFFIVNYFW